MKRLMIFAALASAVWFGSTSNVQADESVRIATDTAIAQASLGQIGVGAYVGPRYNYYGGYGGYYRGYPYYYYGNYYRGYPYYGYRSYPYYSGYRGYPYYGGYGYRNYGYGYRNYGPGGVAGRAVIRTFR